MFVLLQKWDKFWIALKWREKAFQHLDVSIDWKQTILFLMLNMQLVLQIPVCENGKKRKQSL